MAKKDVTHKAILFDLDGTLVNTIGDIAFSINTVLAETGAPPIDDSTCKRYVGKGLRNALSLALYEASVPFDDALLDSYYQLLMETYRAHPHDKAILYPGIGQLLEKSVAAGFKLGVLSNKEDSLVRKIVNALLGGVPFMTVRGATDDIPLKPEPTSAILFSKIAECAVDEVLFIGDSEVDFHTAKAARMRPAVVTWGFRDRFELASNGCDPLFDTIDELETEVFPWQ
jgi:phosphoglycolate phosphatase